MAVEITNNTILKPCPSSPPHPLLNSHVPLTIFDRVFPDFHFTLYAFNPPLPSNETLIQGISQALDLFPHLASRLSIDKLGRPCLILNHAGIRLVETRISNTLAESLPLNPSVSDELKHLYPPVLGVDELIQIQLNCYNCGGLVIGQTANHRVVDGHSLSAFSNAWAKIVRGHCVEQVSHHDRDAIVVPRSPAFCEFDHRSIDFTKATASAPLQIPPESIEYFVVHFSPEFMTKLKKHVAAGSIEGLQYRTFECLLAHLWKKITVARRVADGEFTEARVVVTCRGRAKAVPVDYFGNMALKAYPAVRVKELLSESYAFVAKAIREGVAKVDDAYFQSFVDFGEVLKMEGGEELLEPANLINPLWPHFFYEGTLSPHLGVSSWLSFEFHNLDFGGGGPSALLLAELPIEAWSFSCLHAKTKVEWMPSSLLNDRLHTTSNKSLILSIS